MIREAIQKLEEIIKAGHQPVVIDGQSYWPHKTEPIPPPLEPEATALLVDSLHSLKHYIDVNPDLLPMHNLLIHVESPVQVSLRSPIHGARQQRTTYVRATFDRSSYGFGSYSAIEAAIIGVQALLASTPDRVRLLQTLASVRDEVVTDVIDEGGVHQKVSARSGLTFTDTVQINNPFVLAPYRSFPEIEQVACPFVLRVKKDQHHGLGVGLWEADGGLWMLTATERIREWFAEQDVLTPVI